MGLSTCRDEPPSFFRPDVIRVSLWLVLALWLARMVGRLLLWIIRTPSAVAVITVGTAFLLGWHYVHPALPLGVLGGLLAGLVVWRVRWPVTFEAQVRLRVRTWWRAGLVYRRQWATAMDTAGLLMERRRTEYVPPLLRVRSTRTVDRVTGVTPGRPNFSSIWARALAEAGLSGIHFHDLRHTGNHLAAISGASTRELMGRMGHASVNAALIYQHRTASRDRAIADSLDAMVTALKPSNPRNSGHVEGTATG